MFRDNTDEEEGSRRVCFRHKEIVAVAYCKDCKSFFCQECENSHNGFLGSIHKTISASSVRDFDLHDGKCSTHSNYPLDQLCNDCIGKKHTKSYCHHNYNNLFVSF